MVVAEASEDEAVWGVATAEALVDHEAVLEVDSEVEPAVTPLIDGLPAYLATTSLQQARDTFEVTEIAMRKTPKQHGL